MTLETKNRSEGFKSSRILFAGSRYSRGTCAPNCCRVIVGFGLSEAFESRPVEALIAWQHHGGMRGEERIKLAGSGERSIGPSCPHRTHPFLICQSAASFV